MIFDKQNLLSEDQAITADAASTNVIDLGANSSKIQTLIERGLAKVYAQVTVAFNTLTSLDFILQTDTDEAFGSAVVLSTVNVLLADLVAGKKVDFGPLPTNTERYIRLYYNVVGTDPTTGKIFAGMVLDVQTNGM
jgi:hypothetical protein